MRGFAETMILPDHRHAAILLDIADKIEEHRGEFVHTLVYKSGKPSRQANLDVTSAVSRMRISAEESFRITGKVIHIDDTEQGDGYTGYYYQVPYGPVLCITPFNYPLNIACHKIGPAITAGCSFVLKPSTKKPLSALLLTSLILDAGYSADAVNVVPCFGLNVETLVRDPRFTVLSFTVSHSVSWRLKEIFPGRRVGLRLGRNAPAFVHKDVYIAYAAHRTAEEAVINAGLSCISMQRVYLHTAIYDACLGMILDEIRSFAVGVIPVCRRRMCVR